MSKFSLGKYFRKEKKEIEETEETEPEKTIITLEQICYENEFPYDEMKTILSDPRNTKETAEESLTIAKKYMDEDSKKTLFYLWQAGSLALYENEPDIVRDSFTKLKELGGKHYKKTIENPEKAIKIIQERYNIQLKKEAEEKLKETK